MTGTDKGIYLFMIRSGPVYSLDGFLRPFARSLGAFSGEIVTFGSEPHQAEERGIQIRIYPMQAWKPFMAVHNRLRYALLVVLRALRARWLEGRRLVVITYDPFQSGLMGLAIKWLTGARFICEVNGVYGHPETFVDLLPEKAAKKQERMLRIGSFVLERADAIKLLYPGQLMGFRVTDDERPRVSFHDLVNDELFQPTEEAPTKTLIFVGHPYYLKGVDLLLEAFARVSPDYPDWRLMVVGWNLEREAAKSPYLTEKVTLLGPQSQEALKQLIERSAALVLPSRSEGMGRVLIEAGLLGRARIGSRVGGIPSVIEDGVDGLLFESGNVDDLERVLRTFLGDPALQARFGEAALERARREFTAAEYARLYTRLIHEVTGAGRQEPAASPGQPQRRA